MIIKTKQIEMWTGEQLEFQSFKEKLGSWSDRFHPFIESRPMWDIMQRIKKDSLEDVVVPKSSDLFRAFSTTPMNWTTVIFYLMDPYPRKYSNGTFQATGIAMDCSNSPDGKIQPSLLKWYDALSNSMDEKVNYSPSLEYLHEQGVMLLNTDLTCKLNKTASHEGLWEPFQQYLLEDILGSKKDIIYVLCGKASLRMKKYINPFCKIFELSHPAAASYAGTDWDCQDIFNTINKIITENKIATGNRASCIMWDKNEWDKYKKAPF
jgi:uracil DNA glycosylase